MDLICIHSRPNHEYCSSSSVEWSTGLSFKKTDKDTDKERLLLLTFTSNTTLSNLEQGIPLPDLGIVSKIIGTARWKVHLQSWVDLFSRATCRRGDISNCQGLWRYAEGIASRAGD